MSIDPAREAAQFLVDLHGCESTLDGVVLVDRVVGMVPLFDSPTCAVWLKVVAPMMASETVNPADDLAEWDEDEPWMPHLNREVDHEPSEWDLFEMVLDLFQAILRQLEKAGQPELFDYEAVRPLIETAALRPRTFDLPGREIIDVYIEWVEDELASCLMEYSGIVQRLATPDDHVRIADAFLEVDDPWVTEISEDWVLLATRAARSLRPDRVASYVEHLKRTNPTSPFVEAEVASHQRWVHRDRGPGSALIADYFGSGVLALQVGVVSRTIKLLEQLSDGAQASIRFTNEQVRDLLQRDLEVVRCSRSVQDVVDQVDASVGGVLLAYHQARTLTPGSCLVQSLLLVTALENHLRSRLAQDLDRDGAKMVWAAGLSKLRRWVLSERMGDPEGKYVAAGPELNEQEERALRRAARIRDQVHHMPGEIGVSELNDLERMMFNEEHGAIRIMEVLNGYRLQPRTTG